MVRIDPSMEKIAARLTSASLRCGDEDDDDLLEPETRPFLDVYSVSGLRHALQEYGITTALEDRGLGDTEYRVSREDDFRHRLEIVLSDGRPIMDLRLHLQETPVVGDKPFAVVVVEWLLMQNPRQPFSPQRPRFPGQLHPGTGMGRQVHTLLVLLCRRMCRDALLTVPERFHLALLYRRIDFVAVDPNDDVGIRAVLQAGDDAGVSMAGLAWAVERGFVVDDTGAPWKYTPHTLVCPVSPRLELDLRRQTASSLEEKAGPAALSPRRSPHRQDSSLPTLPLPSLRVDVEGLQRSLVASPVDGLFSIWPDPVDGSQKSR